MAFGERSPIEEGFAPIFDDRIAPELDRLEDIRINAARKARLRVLITLGTGLAFGAVIAAVSGIWLFFFFFAVVGLILGMAWRGMAVTEWKDAIADAVIPPVLEF